MPLNLRFDQEMANVRFHVLSLDLIILVVILLILLKKIISIWCQKMKNIIQIVTPVYNEEKNIYSTIKDFCTLPSGVVASIV